MAFGLFGSAVAQNSRDEARRVILGEQQPRRKVENGNTNRHSQTFPGEQTDSRTNRNYNAKIRSIKNNPNLSRAEKDRIIRQLEKDRKKALKHSKQHQQKKKYKNKKRKYKGWQHRKKHDRDDD